MKRGCGVLVHVSSLPGKTGIGGFTKECFEFIDFLASAKVKYWQVLAFGPTGYGDSPYAPFSCFAGNPYFIDLEEFFSLEELERFGVLCNADKVDFGRQYTNKRPALRELFKRGYDKDEMEEFVRKNKFWIEGYATFRAIKEMKGDIGYLDFAPEFKVPKSKAVLEFVAGNKEAIDYYIFEQMVFEKQWLRVKQYANERGIQIIGDLPIYPAMDSADVWGWNEIFQFEGGKPTYVAGVGPDYFNAEGQLWGNPLYDFAKLGRTKYKWWIERMKHARDMFDVVRIDHFRAIDSYYKIPFGSKSAKDGKWVKGPGIKFLNALNEGVPGVQIVLEDLGDLTKSVLALRDETGYPGMRVMQFGLESEDADEHLPINHPINCVGYTGTHDNDTLVGLLSSLGESQRKYVDKYLHSYNLAVPDVARLAIQDLMHGPADMVVLSIQDVLLQCSESRMNVPGNLYGNWQYRIKEGQLTEEVAGYLRTLIERSGRQ